MISLFFLMTVVQQEPKVRDTPSQAPSVAPPPIVKTPPPIRTIRAATLVPTKMTGFENTRPYSIVGLWNIRVDPTLAGGCFALASYNDGSVVRIQVAPNDQAVYLLIGNWQWRSLASKDSVVADIQFGSYEPWSAEASLVRIGNSNYIGFSIDANFVLEFMAAPNLELSYESKTAAFLDLTDSQNAVAKLRECQAAVETEINDPFAD